MTVICESCGAPCDMPWCSCGWMDDMYKAVHLLHRYVPGWLKNEHLPEHARWSESQQWPDDLPWPGCVGCRRPKPFFE